MSTEWQAKFAAQTELLLQSHSRSELLELVVWAPDKTAMPTMTAFKSSPLNDAQIDRIEAKFSSPAWPRAAFGARARMTDLRGDWRVEEAVFSAARLMVERAASGAGSDELLAELLLYAKHFNPELKRLTVTPSHPTEGVMSAETSGVELQFWDRDR